MPHFHPFFIPPRADAHKGDSISVLRVHIGLDFEDKARKSGLRCLHNAVMTFPGLRRWRPVNKIVQHLFDTKVTECSTKEYRGQLTAQESLQGKLM